MPTTETDIALLKQNFWNMQKQLDSIEQKVDKIMLFMDEKYVTKEQFSTVKNIVYGMVSVILIAVLWGVLSLVLIK